MNAQKKPTCFFWAAVFSSVEFERRQFKKLALLMADIVSELTILTDTSSSATSKA